MAESKFTPKELEDYLSDFSAGMNSGISPLLLKHNQSAFMLNATVRGAFARNRPPFQNFTLIFEDETVQSEFEGGLFQGLCFYNPDSGDDAIVAAISGKLYKITPSTTEFSATVEEVSDASTEQSATATQHWLWQAEKWVIWNDGINLPVFYDGTSCVRSRGQIPPAPPVFPSITSQYWQVPAVGSDTVSLNTTGDFTAFVGQNVTVDFVGVFVIKSAPSASTVILTTVGSPYIGAYVIAGDNLFQVTSNNPVTFIPQLPPGRMGTYGLGRVCMCLVDGKQFVMSDLVGGSSGTAANNYRDAVLAVTENAFLSSGGYFTVPGSVGDIQAMRFSATLDVSLGQGPLQVFTPNTVFSCNAPTDRTTWQNLVNPILTESLISNGATSQNATVLANGDIIFRSVGITIRSLILARREFATWGNVPISDEMERVLLLDDTTLLQYASACVFNNRLLMTAAPLGTDQGVIHQGTVVINFDPLSSLRGKLPAVWDGLWTGLNTLQYVSDKFNNVERCFSLSLNVVQGKIELYEIQQDDAQIADNGAIPIIWDVESGSLDFGQRDPASRDLLRLRDGEIYVDQLEGRVDFRVYYKPDQYPCWTLWRQWAECADIASTQPQFRPRMGLGEPDVSPCDASTNRPLRNGYTFQFKIVIQGRCRFLGARFRSITEPQPKFAPPGCPCPDEPTPRERQYIFENGFLQLLGPNGQFFFFGVTSIPAQLFVDAEQKSQVRFQSGYLQVLNESDGLWYAVIATEDPIQFGVFPASEITTAANPAKFKRDGFVLWLFNDTTGLFHRVGISGVPPQLTLRFVGEL